MKLAVFVALIGSLSQAATLYTTFGAGDTYSVFNDAVGDGHTFNQTWGAMWADPFTVSGPSHVSAYRVAVRGGTANARFVLSLWEGSTAPSTLIEGNIISPVLDGTQQILTLISPTLPALNANLTYWLVMEAADPVADTLYWYRNDFPGSVRKRALTGFPWGTGFQGSDVFEIQGTADTPEPATGLLAVVALCSMAWRRRT